MKLTNHNINESIQSLEHLLTDNLQIKLLIEEVLLHFQEHFGNDKNYELITKKFLGITKILIKVKGRQYNPLETKKDDDFSILTNLLDYDGNTPSYRFNKNINEVSFVIRKKEKIKIPGGKLTVAVFLALITGLFARLLPASVLEFLISVLIEPLSSRLPKLVSALTIPLIFTSVLSGICALEEVSSLSSLGTRVLKRFAITIIFILLLTLPLCIIGFNGVIGGNKGTFDLNTLITLFLQIIPTNFFTPFTEANAVQVVFIAFIVGVAILMLNEKADSIKQAIPHINILVMQMMKLVTGVIPYTVFFSLFKTFATSSISTILSVWRIILINYLANIIVSMIIILRLIILRKVNVKEYIAKIAPLLFTAFTTSSTSTGMPMEYTICQDELKIDKKIYNFWIPLSHAMFSVSVVIPLLVGTFYTAHTTGQTISYSTLILIFVMIIELCIASPKIPGGIVATYTLLFTQIGLSTETLGILMAANIFIINFEVMNEVLIKFCDLKDLSCLLEKEK